MFVMVQHAPTHSSTRRALNRDRVNVFPLQMEPIVSFMEGALAAGDLIPSFFSGLSRSLMNLHLKDIIPQEGSLGKLSHKRDL